MYLRGPPTFHGQIIIARKRSFGQGNIFTGVCLSTGGLCLWSHVSSRGLPDRDPGQRFPRPETPPCVFVCLPVCVCLFTCVFVYQCVSLFTCVFVCLPVCFFVYPCICVFTCVFVCLSMYFFVYLCICLFTCVFVCSNHSSQYPVRPVQVVSVHGESEHMYLFVYPCICLFTCVFVCLPVCLFVYLCICLL